MGALEDVLPHPKPPDSGVSHPHGTAAVAGVVPRGRHSERQTLCPRVGRKVPSLRPAAEREPCGAQGHLCRGEEATAKSCDAWPATDATDGGE